MLARLARTKTDILKKSIGEGTLQLSHFQEGYFARFSSDVQNMYAGFSQAHQPTSSCGCRGSFGRPCRDPLLRMLPCLRIHGDGTGANMMQCPARLATGSFRVQTL